MVNVHAWCQGTGDMNIWTYAWPSNGLDRPVLESNFVFGVRNIVWPAGVTDETREAASAEALRIAGSTWDKSFLHMHVGVWVHGTGEMAEHMHVRILGGVPKFQEATYTNTSLSIIVTTLRNCDDLIARGSYTSVLDVFYTCVSFQLLNNVGIWMSITVVSVIPIVTCHVEAVNYPGMHSGMQCYSTKVHSSRGAWPSLWFRPITARPARQ